jgi:hypothetical protein
MPPFIFEKPSFAQEGFFFITRPTALSGQTDLRLNYHLSFLYKE